MSISRMNGTDRAKQLISKIIQITHSQWIYRNISLHYKTNRHLHNKTADELAEAIHRLAEHDPEDVPNDIKFLLEMDREKLIKRYVETQAYWVTAVLAARKAQAKNLRWEQEQREKKKGEV